MDRLISYLIALSVAAGLMFAWDRHGPVGFHLPIPFIHPWVGLPPSLGQQRDDAVAARDAEIKAAAGWQNDVTQLQGQLGASRASILALAADRNRKVAAAEAQLHVEEKAAADAMNSVSSLMAYQPKGADVCARAGDMQDWIKKDLSR